MRWCRYARPYTWKFPGRWMMIDPNLTRVMARTILRIEDAIRDLNDVRGLGLPLEYNNRILTETEDKEILDMLARLHAIRKELNRILASADYLESAGVDPYPKRGG